MSIFQTFVPQYINIYTNIHFHWKEHDHASNAKCYAVPTTLCRVYHAPTTLVRQCRSYYSITSSDGYAPMPRFTKNLKSDRNRKPISGAKMRFTKIMIL